MVSGGVVGAGSGGTGELTARKAGLEKTRVSIVFLSEIFLICVLFVHKKSVSKRKVCIIFIKNKKLKKKTKNSFSVGGWGWVRWFFLGFLGGFFIANPGAR